MHIVRKAKMTLVFLVLLIGLIGISACSSDAIAPVEDASVEGYWVGRHDSGARTIRMAIDPSHELVAVEQAVRPDGLLLEPATRVTGRATVQGDEVVIDLDRLGVLVGIVSGERISGELRANGRLSVVVLERLGSHLRGL